MPSILVSRHMANALSSRHTLRPCAFERSFGSDAALSFSSHTRPAYSDTRAPSDGAVDHFEHLGEVHFALLRAVNADGLVVDLDVAVGKSQRALLSAQQNELMASEARGWRHSRACCTIYIYLYPFQSELGRTPTPTSWVDWLPVIVS